jgi:hypothetical protein
MATQTINCAPDSSTLANWKAWAKGLSDAIVALGWTRTADTGQVDWATVAVVPTAGNFVYEVFQATDSLAGTAPIFVKLEYTLNGIAVTVGLGSNGAGVLVSASQRNVSGTWVASAAFSGNIRVSGNAGTLAFCLWSNRPNNLSQSVFTVERSWDSDGGATADFVSYFCVLAAACAHQICNYSGGAWNPAIAVLLTLLPASASASVGNNLGCSPAFPYNGRAENPSVTFGVMKEADAVNEGTISIDLYGVTHTFMEFINTSSINIRNAAIGNNNAALMRWE